MDYRGKVAWVTGASSGIGEGLAYELSARGAAVIISGRRLDALDAVSARITGPNLVLPFEGTDFDVLPDIVERAIAWRMGVDILINNAGVSQRSLAIDTSFAVYRRLMDVNFLAPLRLTQLVLPHMIERRSGHLSVVSSGAGKVGIPLRTGYCAAKHACVGYFDSLRSEIEQTYGIDVSVILPGAVATRVTLSALRGDGRPNSQSEPAIEEGLTPRCAAEIILDGIAEGRREIAVMNDRELAMLQLRGADPEALFAATAEMGAVFAPARDVR